MYPTSCQNEGHLSDIHAWSKNTVLLDLPVLLRVLLPLRFFYRRWLPVQQVHLFLPSCPILMKLRRRCHGFVCRRPHCRRRHASAAASRPPSLCHDDASLGGLQLLRLARPPEQTSLNAYPSSVPIGFSKCAGNLGYATRGHTNRAVQVAGERTGKLTFHEILIPDHPISNRPISYRTVTLRNSVA